MPRGVLGYSGSLGFSARDVLASLRKLQALRPDVVLPGHGAAGGPAARMIERRGRPSRVVTVARRLARGQALSRRLD
jgi:glyoxylase-like metal-dependent hydrolase (beta-lactamase superfamily II)